MMIKNNNGMAQIIGIILIFGITILIVLAVGLSIYHLEYPQKVTLAYITVDKTEGGLYADDMNYSDNWIVLYHVKGHSLNISDTKILIRGYGEVQNTTYSTTGNLTKGNIVVEYIDLKKDGKYNTNYKEYEPYDGYNNSNPDLKDGYWSQGEKLTLNGQDSTNGSNYSSVKVYMQGVAKTSNNWRFKRNSEITITIIDKKSDRTIIELSTLMNQTTN